MEERNRSRSPIRPIAAPIIVSNGNAEEMDGTERYGTVAHRPSERRQVRPGEARRAEVGVIGQRRPIAGLTPQQMAAYGAAGAMRNAPIPVVPTPTRLDWYEYAVARTSSVATLNAAAALVRAIHAFVQAAPTAPERPPPSVDPAEREPRRATGRAPIARTSRTAARDDAVVTTINPHRDDEQVPRTVTTQRRQPPPPATPGEQLTALARRRMAASDKLKLIAASLNNRPPTRTSVVADARMEAILRIRSEVALIEDEIERAETQRMLDSIFAPGSLQGVRALYQQMPLWEENAPPPPGWPFRLPGQRTDMRQRTAQHSIGNLPQEMDYNRDATRRNRSVEANEAARDLFEELLANGIFHHVNGVIPRLPRMPPDLLPSFEMVQMRDLPAMLAAQQARGVPPEHRVEDTEEHAVPTGPSMRSPLAVPVINSQARLREYYESEYRRRAGTMTSESTERQQARLARSSRNDEAARAAMDRGEEMPPPPARPAPRPFDTPHPGVVPSRADGPANAPPVSPLAANIPRMVREQVQILAREHRRIMDHMRFAPVPGSSARMPRPPSPTDSIVSQVMDDGMEDDGEQAGPSTSRRTERQQRWLDEQRRMVQLHPIPPMPPSTSFQETARRAQEFASTMMNAPPEQSTTKIKVHKLRPSAHRGPGQRKETSGLLGARRLNLEQKALVEMGGVERVEAAPSPDNIRTWTAVVEGAEGTQFEGGVFFFDIFFPKNYPMGHIKMACLTHIVHPYVAISGMVDLDKMAKLCFDVDKFSEIKFGGVERALRVAAAVVSGILPRDLPEKEKLWVERGKVFTKRYAC